MKVKTLIENCNCFASFHFVELGQPRQYAVPMNLMTDRAQTNVRKRDIHIIAAEAPNIFIVTLAQCKKCNSGCSYFPNGQYDGSNNTKPIRTMPKHCLLRK